MNTLEILRSAEKVYFNEKVTPHLGNNLVAYHETAGQPSRNKLLGGAYALLHPIHSAKPFDLSIVESISSLLVLRTVLRRTSDTPS
ncbi:MAG TPA: hypothetical protein VI727_09435 [Candidatus Brocadiaceae bacterium]|nr:hypothetical protein [Candidatus Brocadiaceae bacterium]